MISTALNPPETTIPENLPVRQRGVIQLKLNSTLSILNFLKSTLTIVSTILRSVQTFSKITTVLLLTELLMCVQKIVQNSSSTLISYSCSDMSVLKGIMSEADIVFLGVLSETRPTLIHSLPSSMMISYFLLYIIL